jgi:hypothetical protein
MPNTGARYALFYLVYYPFVRQPKPTLAGGAARAQVASLPCILHNILLVISIIRMKSLPAVPLQTKGHFTENTASNRLFYPAIYLLP